VGAEGGGLLLWLSGTRSPHLSLCCVWVSRLERSRLSDGAFLRACSERL